MLLLELRKRCNVTLFKVWGMGLGENFLPYNQAPVEILLF